MSEGMPKSAPVATRWYARVYPEPPSILNIGIVRMTGEVLAKFNEQLRQVLFDVRAGNSDLAISLGEKSNHAMYQNENRHRGLLSLENYQN